MQTDLTRPGLAPTVSCVTGDEAVSESLAWLREHLDFQSTSVSNYTVITVHGCDSDAAIEHIARFLVGAIAQVVRLDLELQPALISSGLDGQAELQQDLAKILHPHGEPLSDYDRTHTRDPWIGEALGHLVLVLSDQAPHPCVPAPVVASHLPHVEARDHGLDLFAFSHPDLGVVIGEAKTSKSGIGNGLIDAEVMFDDIEEGKRDHDIRQAVNGLMLALDDGLRGQVVGAIWKDSRSYLPVLCFQSGLNLSTARDGLKKLGDNNAGCRLVAFKHADHDQFFHRVAEQMEQAIEVISPV